MTRADSCTTPYVSLQGQNRQEVRPALRKRAASEPSDPYVLGDLVVNYAEQRVTLAGYPVRLIAMEYRMLAELSANGGRVLT